MSDKYKRLFKSNNKYVKRELARSSVAPKFSKFIKLFTDDDEVVRKNIARNPYATSFEKNYKKLFLDNHAIKYNIAANPNAVQFKEFENLFSDKNDKFNEIKAMLASNPNATKLKEFENLFSYNDLSIKRNIAANPNATHFKEFKNLFNDDNRFIRDIACEKIDDYKKYHKIPDNEYISNKCSNIEKRKNKEQKEEDDVKSKFFITEYIETINDPYYLTQFCISKEAPRDKYDDIIEKGEIKSNNFYHEYSHGSFDTKEEAIYFIQNELPNCWKLDDRDPMKNDYLECWGYDKIYEDAYEFFNEWSDNDLNIHKGMTKKEIEIQADKIFNDLLEKEIFFKEENIEKYLTERLEELEEYK